MGKPILLYNAVANATTSTKKKLVMSLLLAERQDLLRHLFNNRESERKSIYRAKIALASIDIDYLEYTALSVEMIKRDDISPAEMIRLSAQLELQSSMTKRERYVQVNRSSIAGKMGCSLRQVSRTTKTLVEKKLMWIRQFYTIKNGEARREANGYWLPIAKLFKAAFKKKIKKAGFFFFKKWKLNVENHLWSDHCVNMYLRRHLYQYRDRIFGTNLASILEKRFAKKSELDRILEFVESESSFEEFKIAA